MTFTVFAFTLNLIIAIVGAIVHINDWFILVNAFFAGTGLMTVYIKAEKAQADRQYDQQ